MMANILMSMAERATERCAAERSSFRQHDE
jgi:hypothetical protein